MPYINLKLVKSQVSSEQKANLVEGITDLVVEIMGRDRNFTIITVDELEESQWSIGGKLLSEENREKKIVSFVNIKVSKGTTNPVEIEDMMRATKDLMVKILGNCHETNYFVMDELNPEGWGFDGIPMATRRKLNQ